MKTSITPKARKTQQRILDAAYKQFSKNGYKKTTMRMIAKDMGIAVGGIYHHFPSKAHIVQAYYSEMVFEDEAHCRLILPDYEKLRDRLQAVLQHKIERNLGQHKLAQSLFKEAADPHSPLSPFSEESRQTRERSIQLFCEIVEGSSDRIEPKLAELLPDFFWLYQMGIILFWVHDESEGSANTLSLIKRTISIIDSLLNMMRNPLFRPFRSKVMQILVEFQPHFGGNNEQRK